MTEYDSKREKEIRDTPEWKATIGEVNRLWEKSKRLVQRQERDLRVMLVSSEQRELLDHLLTSITMREILESCSIRLDTFASDIHDAGFKRTLLECQLLLSQQE